MAARAGAQSSAMAHPDRLKAEIAALRAENARLRRGTSELPVPAWFADAVAVRPTDHAFVDESTGLRVHYCRWGVHDPAKRGLVFVHGGFAHAHCEPLPARYCQR